jgi:hypothetical protein
MISLLPADEFPAPRVKHSLPQIDREFTSKTLQLQCESAPTNARAAGKNRKFPAPFSLPAGIPTAKRRQSSGA